MKQRCCTLSYLWSQVHLDIVDLFMDRTSWWVSVRNLNETPSFSSENTFCIKQKPPWCQTLAWVMIFFAYLNIFNQSLSKFLLINIKYYLNANKLKRIISIPLSHFRDDATKYPLRTPWHRRHGKRELFPERLSMPSRPWFAIVSALSKSSAGHS